MKLDFSLTEEQVLLQQLTERFVADRYPISERPGHLIPTSGRNDSNWALLAELGLLALPIGEEFGGLGGGPVETMIVMEGLGRGLVAEPVLQEIYLAALLLARIGGPAAAEPLAAIVEGRGHYALAWAESGRRYRIDKPRTTAVHEDGRIRIRGAKTFVLAGADTDGFIVSAHDQDGVLRLYLVEGRTRGLHRNPYRLVDGSTAEELELENVVGLPLKGDLSDLEWLADQARFAGSAEMLGIMETLFQTTLDYVRTRKQFGVPIGSFQTIQHRMADLYATLESARSLLYRAALADAASRPAGIAALKNFAGAKGVQLAEECVQLHGGMGISDELIIGHGLKRMLVLASLFGDPDEDLLRYMRLTRGSRRSEAASAAASAAGEHGAKLVFEELAVGVSRQRRP
jgi:alkylation response protein AidB-like acyl-CoA dehydrogenase